MKYRQLGFGGMQVLIAIVVLATVTLVAVPKYKSFVTKSKITEAFGLAGESKQKLSQFYMVNNRFPLTASEAEVSKSWSLSPPKFVSRMEVKPGYRNHDIAVIVYLKDGVVENETGGAQFIYIAGDKTPNSESAVRWTCGANGIAADLLPDNCVE